MTQEIEKQEAGDLDAFGRRMQTIKEAIAKSAKIYERAAPPGVDIGRYIDALLRACGKNTKVRMASIDSLKQSLLDSVSMGLIIGGQLGYGYVVPYKGVAQFQIGYQGLLHLAYNDGRATDAAAEVVREGDLFDYKLGTNRWVDHKPSLEPSDERPIIGAYAVISAQGQPFVQVSGIDDLDAHAHQYVKKNYETGKFPDDALYVTNPVRWYQKTMLRRALKYCPLSEAARSCLNAEDIIDAGGDLDAEPKMQSGDEQPTENLRALVAGAAPLEGQGNDSA